MYERIFPPYCGRETKKFNDPSLFRVYHPFAQAKEKGLCDEQHARREWACCGCVEENCPHRKAKLEL